MSAKALEEGGSWTALVDLEMPIFSLSQTPFNSTSSKQSTWPFPYSIDGRRTRLLLRSSLNELVSHSIAW